MKHLKQGKSLMAFVEDEQTRILAPPELSFYVTHFNEKPLKLTSRILFLRDSSQEDDTYNYLELYDPGLEEAFARAVPNQRYEEWVDHDFVILDGNFAKSGVIYTPNPRPSPYTSLEGFFSRAELIRMGENIYKAEGCWYCHTDQSRTLVEDCVVNGSNAYPAPPSSASEYIYQEVTFPGTKRNGPDISRTAVKHPDREWHQAHFYFPRTKSLGTIMPAYRHFFDKAPEGASLYSVPNVQFEAIYQYLMTKGTRITSPDKAWWNGKDPVDILKMITEK